MIARVNVVLNRSQVLLTLKMTTAQVVETSVTVHNNSPIQDYVHPDDQTQPTYIHSALFCSSYQDLFHCQLSRRLRVTINQVVLKTFDDLITEYSVNNVLFDPLNSAAACLQKNFLFLLHNARFLHGKPF